GNTATPRLVPPRLLRSASRCRPRAPGRRAARLARPPVAADRSFSRWRHHGHPGAHPRRTARGAARPNGGRGEPRRCRRRDRGGDRFARRAGRLQPVPGDHRHRRDQPAPARAAELPAGGPGAGRPLRRVAQRDGGAARRAVADTGSVPGGSAGAARRTHLRQLGQRQQLASLGRDAEGRRRGGHPARALPRRGRHREPDPGRAGGRGHEQPALRRRAGPRRPAPRAGRHRAGARGGAARRADRGRERPARLRRHRLVRRAGAGPHARGGDRARERGVERDRRRPAHARAGRRPRRPDARWQPRPVRRVHPRGGRALGGRHPPLRCKGGL
ncbi:MAG: BUG/TctC family periplasmic protein, partial [uncultured Acetobacteraceae bacterium]